jgi:hypothetical protein
MGSSNWPGGFRAQQVRKFMTDVTGSWRLGQGQHFSTADRLMEVL